MQLDHPLSRLVIVGQSGSGKTTYAARYLANIAAKVRYIWDPEGEWAGRFNLPVCRTGQEMWEAAPFGWVCYDPSEEFEDEAEGLECFAEWVMTHAGRIGGRKVFVIDEMHQYVTGHKLTPHLKALVTRGRRRGVDSVFLATSPNTVHNIIRSNTTERVAFHCDDPTSSDVLKSWGFDFEEVAKLPRHAWIARTGMGGVSRFSQK
jgi:GTPase SAR1 family protein